MKTQLITFGDGQPANLNDLEFSLNDDRYELTIDETERSVETKKRSSSSGTISLSLSPINQNNVRYD